MVHSTYLGVSGCILKKKMYSLVSRYFKTIFRDRNTSFFFLKNLDWQHLKVQMDNSILMYGIIHQNEKESLIRACVHSKLITVV